MHQLDRIERKLDMIGLKLGIQLDAPPPAAVSGPPFANVKFLTHLDGADGSTTFTDVIGHVLAANGNAALDTADKQFGTASLLVNTAGVGFGHISATYVTADFDWWTQDYSLEIWVKPTSLASAETAGIPVLIGNNSPSTLSSYWSFGPLADGTVRMYYFNGVGANYVTSTATVNLNDWNYIAFKHEVGVGVSISVNGTVSGPTAVSGTPLSSAAETFIIGRLNGTQFVGWIDEARIVKGSAANIAVVPTAAFPDA